MTRIRTWVTSATTKGTNHYTITAIKQAYENSSSKSSVDSNETKSTKMFNFLRLKIFFYLFSDAIVKAKWLPQLKEDHAKHHFLVTQVGFFTTAFKVQYTSQLLQLQWLHSCAYLIFLFFFQNNRPEVRKR